MKKGLLLAGVLSLFIGTASKAQNFHWGLKAGLMFSSMHGSGMESSVKPGFQGGAFAEWDLSKNKKWGFQPELLFTQATAKTSSDFTTYFVSNYNTYYNSKIKMSEINVPLLARYNPIPNLTINAGVQYTYIFFADENLFKSNRAALKSSDIGAVAGVQVKVANVRFFGRYVYGINNLLAIETPENIKWHSQQITFGIGIGIK